jgi:predicted nucleotidyltransferase
MKTNQPIKLANLRMLEFVAIKLSDLREEVVFVGGCTTALFITDPEFLDVRYTTDVDCVADVITLSEYHKFEKQLSKLGFKKSLTESVICRWFYDDITLDVMPTDEKVLGFGNRWYKKAITNSMIHPLTDKLNIRVVTAPYFLATKLEAFKTRGKMDFYASHDFEDIVSVLDGRSEIIKEIHQADSELKEYLLEKFTEIDDSRAFRGAIPGHFVQYGSEAEDRAGILEERIRMIIKK